MIDCKGNAYFEVIVVIICCSNSNKIHKRVTGFKPGFAAAGAPKVAAGVAAGVALAAAPPKENPVGVVLDAAGAPKLEK